MPRDWSRLIAGLALSAPAALVARAETYLSEAQAAAIFFLGVKLEPRTIELTTEQAKAVSRASGERVRDRKIRVWRGPSGETMIGTLPVRNVPGVLITGAGAMPATRPLAAAFVCTECCASATGSGSSSGSGSPWPAPRSSGR